MREQSVTAAKERLKCMIHYENNILDEETMGYIRRDIGNVITKYVDVEPENIEIKVILKEYKKRELQCLNSQFTRYTQYRRFFRQRIDPV